MKQKTISFRVDELTYKKIQRMIEKKSLLIKMVNKQFRKNFDTEVTQTEIIKLALEEYDSHLDDLLQYSHENVKAK